MAQVQPDAGLLLVTEAWIWSLEQGLLFRLFCGSTEMRTLLLWFVPWLTEENGRRKWPETLAAWAQVREQMNCCSGFLPL